MHMDTNKFVNKKEGGDYPKVPHYEAPKTPCEQKFDKPLKPATAKGGMAS